MSIENQILLKENSKPGILRLIMNDPNRKNALSENMMDTLTDAIASSSEDKSIKVIIIAANGNVFSSGHDLKELTLARDYEDDGNSYFMKLFDVCSLLMQSIVDCPKPVIAEVNGVATAAGCQLVASCDLAISSDNSKFATPGVNLGLFCSTPMVALSRNVSKKEAMKMLLTGDWINAQEAKRISLINDHFPEDQLKEAVIEIASKISAKSQIAVKIGKQAFYDQYEMSLSDAYVFTSTVMTENSLKNDAKEGISAFLDKRHPKWLDN